MYFEARYLATAAARFTGQDPEFYDMSPAEWMLNPQTQNSYAYTAGNPLVYIDPTGRFRSLQLFSHQLKSKLNISRQQINQQAQAAITSAATTAIDFTPVGDLAYAYSGITGHNPLTGESLSTSARVTALVVGAADAFVPGPVRKTDKLIGKLLKGAKRMDKPSRNQTQIFRKRGTFEDARSDFDSLNPTDVQLRDNGTTTGVLEDGTNINVRSESRDGAPTVEIQRDNPIKIRYDDK